SPTPTAASPAPAAAPTSAPRTFPWVNSAATPAATPSAAGPDAFSRRSGTESAPLSFDLTMRDAASAAPAPPTAPPAISAVRATLKPDTWCPSARPMSHAALPPHGSGVPARPCPSYRRSSFEEFHGTYGSAGSIGRQGAPRVGVRRVRDYKGRGSV